MNRLTSSAFALASLLSAPLSMSAFAGDTAFNLDDLEALTRKTSIRTMDKFLALLPAELRTNPVLMRESRSVQGASAQKPRVLLSNGDASFILAFNAEDASIGGSSFEMIQFHPEKKNANGKTEAPRFEFATLKFDASSKPELKRDLMTCGGCHGSADRGRPNWEPFPKAPGAYGEVADTIAPGSKEEANLVSFIQSAKSHPRYRHLLDLEKTHLERDSHGRMAGHPNSKLGEAIGILNAKRVAGIVVHQENADYETYRYSILASLYCESMPDFASAFFPKNSDVPASFATIEEGSASDKPAAFFWGFFRRGAAEFFLTTSFGDMMNERPLVLESSASLHFAHALVDADPVLSALIRPANPSKAIPALPTCETLRDLARGI